MTAEQAAPKQARIGVSVEYPDAVRRRWEAVVAECAEMCSAFDSLAIEYNLRIVDPSHAHPDVVIESKGWHL